MSLRLRLISSVRQAWFSARGVGIAEGCRLGPGVSLERGVASARSGVIELGARARLEAGAIVHAWGGRISIGRDVFIGPYAVVYGHGGVEIGDGTLISMHCRILSSNHAIPAQGKAIRELPDELRPTSIGRDVWLGAGVTVLGGVVIGDGCIVGAGAVVTKSLPPGSIAIGVPAAITGWRDNARPA